MINLLGKYVLPLVISRGIRIRNHNYKATVCNTYVIDMLINSIPLSHTFQNNFLILIFDVRITRVKRNKVN